MSGRPVKPTTAGQVPPAWPERQRGQSEDQPLQQAEAFARFEARRSKSYTTQDETDGN